MRRGSFVILGDERQRLPRAGRHHPLHCRPPLFADRIDQHMELVLLIDQKDIGGEAHADLVGLAAIAIHHDDEDGPGPPHREPVRMDKSLRGTCNRK
jgi:hypothetical protein